MAAPLRTVADRRIRDAQALDVRGPLSSRLTPSATPLGTAPASGASAPTGSGLTRRERRVKAVLLKELERMHKGGKSWISYQERHKLFKTLDVAFIDRETAKMERQLRKRPWLVGLVGSFYLALVWSKVLTHLGDPLTWSAGLDIGLGLALAASMAATMVSSYRATRRRLWIYQALRELSDAEDEGVQLDESVRLADLLIDRIIDQEQAAAPAPLHRIRTH